MSSNTKKQVKKITTFVGRYPFVGPLLWILAIQYFAVQLIVARAWPSEYSWQYNVISDLGAVSCGPFGNGYVCSPLSWLMNISFVFFGVTIAVGALLIYQVFKKSTVSKIGFGLMIASGIGTIGVGFFPEDAFPAMHLVSAVIALLLGNVAILFIAAGVRDMPKSIRWYSYITGTVCVTAFMLFACEAYLGLGVGGMERLVSYPFTIWMIVFGFYAFRKRTS